MNEMNFEEDFKRYLVRLQRMREQLKDLTEEATKNALIMPFFSMLGYDVFDTTEFLPEYVCDFSIKKGEKIIDFHQFIKKNSLIYK